MPIGISPVSDQSATDGTVPVQERRIGALDQVPRQRPSAARWIEPALRLHDDTPSQTLAEFANKSRHDRFF